MSAFKFVTKKNTPKYDDLRKTLTFSSGGLNGFQTEEVRNSFYPWQRKFGVFSWMKFDEILQQFTIHTLKGHPFLWQPHKSCQWTPGTGLIMGRDSVPPQCKAKLNEQYCYDPLFKSCFQPFLKWDGKNPVKLDARGQGMIDDTIELVSKWATLGLMASLTMGGFFDTSKMNVDFRNKKIPSSVKNAFIRSSVVCEGLFSQMYRLAKHEGKHWMNLPIFKQNLFTNSKSYRGSIIGMYDEIRKTSGRDALLDRLDIGNIFGGDGEYNIALVDPWTYREFIEEYRSQCVDGNCKNNRLEAKDCPIGSDIVKVYKIDNTYLVPFHIPSLYTEYLTGCLRFMYVTVSGNLALGGSFDNLLDLPLDDNGNHAGIMIQHGNNAYDLGHVYLLAHQLMANMICNEDLIAGGQFYAVNKTSLN